MATLRFRWTVILALTLAAALSGEENRTEDATGFQWIPGPVVRYIGGMAKEIVYDTSGIDNQNEYLSLLTWELKNIVTVGTAGYWDSGESLRIDLDLSTAIPGMPSGEMNDWDWNFTDRDWSHWSLSDIRLRWGFLADVTALKSVADAGPLTLDVGVGYHMDWWAWRDSVSDSVYSSTYFLGNYPQPFGTYPQDDFRDLDDFLDIGERTIDYAVAYHSLLMVLGLALDWEVPFLKLRGAFGPALAISHDHHLLTGRNYYDVGFGGPWMEADLIIGFRTSGGFTASLGGSWNWLPETSGSSLQISDSGYSYGWDPERAGFSFYRWEVSFRFGWILP